MERLRLLFEISSEFPAERAGAYRPNTIPFRRASRPIEAVVMEMPGVLYDDTLWPRWLWQLLGRLGLSCPFESFWRVFELEYWPAVCAGERELWDALTAYFAEIGLSRGRIEEVRIAAEARRRQWESELRPFPGVAATLAALAKRPLPLFVLTNSCCTSAELSERLGTMGLGTFFADVISSRDLGAALPHPTAWQAVSNSLKLPNSLVALVSRDPRVLRGGAAAGFLTIAVHVARQTPASLCLDQFSDLADALAFERCKSHVA